MARCNCGPTGCSCVVTPGTGISVGGDGSQGAPYVITADGVTSLRGSVAPEGNVVGNPGDVYASDDLAATQGRSLWFKASGTGDTGWILVAGDTGWRDISATMINGWVGTLAVRRTESVVEYRLLDADDTAATADVVAPIPTGFDTAAGTIVSVPATGVAVSDGGALLLTVSSTSVSLPGSFALAGDHEWDGSAVGHGTDVWPSVLPGVALA